MVGSDFGPDQVEPCEYLLTQLFLALPLFSLSATMTSILDDIIADAQNTAPTPSTPLMQRDASPSPDRDSNPLSDSEDNSTRGQDTQSQAGTQDSPDAVAAFTINTARNL